MKKDREEYLALIERLKTKFNIKVETHKVLTFEDLMIVNTRKPGFFYQFKKNRTQMLKEQEVKPKERFYRTYIRQQEERAAAMERKRLALEKK